MAITIGSILTDIAAQGISKYVNIGLIVVGVSSVAIGYGYVVRTENQLTKLTNENVVYKTQTAEDSVTIATLKNNFVLQRKVLSDLYAGMLSANIDAARVQAFIKNLNVSEFTTDTPDETEKLLNDQETMVQRCIELASGATKVSGEKNTVCPDLL